MPRRKDSPSQPEPEERPEDRWLLEEQTARNLAGMEAEREARLDDAVALYERNVAEGFPADWPYGRLVAIYERRGEYAEAARVLRRGIEVMQSSRKRTAQDRRTMVQTFKARLRMVEKQARRRPAKG